MKQEALFKKLGNILSELNDQYQFLSQNPAQLNELELELFLANANFLADHIQIIKKLNLTQYPAVAPLSQQAALEDNVIDDEVGDELMDVQQLEAITFANTQEQELEIEQAPIAQQVEDIPVLASDKDIFKLETEPEQTFEFILNTGYYSEDDKFDFEEKTADQLFDRPLSNEEELILRQKKKVKENLIRDPEDLEDDEIGPEPFLVKDQIAVEEMVTEPTSLPLNEELMPPAAKTENVMAETKKVELEAIYKPTLNDMLAGQNAISRINDSSSTTVTDLKAAISLNDKLLYIKDLFNGYNLAYAEAIDIANKMPNFDAADNFFQKNYAVKNNWADKQATVDKFYLLLNRRFRD